MEKWTSLPIADHTWVLTLFLKGRWAVSSSCKLALSGKLLFLTKYWPVSIIIASTLYKEDAY